MTVEFFYVHSNRRGPYVPFNKLLLKTVVKSRTYSESDKLFYTFSILTYHFS